MNRIDSLFASKTRDILSVYFTAGYPALGDTVPTIRALEAHGADMVEIGIPFSDPMADGPVIQRSGAAARGNGMTLSTLFEQLADVRRHVRLPLVAMSYLNPILRYGTEKFCADCARVGIDGLIIPDLPLSDFLRDFKPALATHGLSFVPMITPETSEERVRLLDGAAGGFIYMVSTASTTGARDTFDERTVEYFRRVEAMGLRHPRLVGFGVSNRDTFRAACDHASGAIVGSAFVRLAGTSPSVDEAAAQLMRDLGLR